jgi:hypothetical protein
MILGMGNENEDSIDFECHYTNSGKNVEFYILIIISSFPVPLSPCPSFPDLTPADLI